MNPTLDFCLLIPCYNNFEGLIESINTVTYPSDKYIIVIVDDGSDKPLKEIEVNNRLAGKKPLVILTNEKNSGITKALNKGIDWIQNNTSSKYIARLDCGDTCSPDRFTQQVAYMDAHAQILLLGSWCRFEEKKTAKGYNYTTPLVHKKILKAMHFRNVFIHPTIMLRVAALSRTGNYPEEFPYAEDYALFWKVIHTGESHILPNILVTCEISITGISYKNRRRQLFARYKVVRTFSKSGILTMLGCLKLLLLSVVPKELILLLKRSR